jgi:UDP-glucose 4-epimerase
LSKTTATPRVLVLGGSSFIGRHFLSALQNQGIDFIAIVSVAAKNRNLITEFGSKIMMANHETCFDDAAVIAELGKFSPDVLVDLSWAGVAGEDRNNDFQFRNVSRLGDNILKASMFGVVRYVGVGSQAEYGPKSQAISEDAAEQPTTLYGAAKLASRYATEILCKHLGIDHVWVRVFSTYGPGDSKKWLIPSLVQAIYSGEKIPLTLGEQLWDYLHVVDAGSAFVEIVKNNNLKGVVNLGSGQTVRISNLVTKVRDFLNPEYNLDFGSQAYREDQVMHLQADIRKLTGATGWKPAIDIESGISSTVSAFIEELGRR